MSGDVWYHGSPARLGWLAPGSTITRDRRLAVAFSHKPRVVSVEDGGWVRHDGRESGYLYQVSEVVRQDDVEPHPRSSMPAGVEWLTRRQLRLTCLGPSALTLEELLSDEEICQLSVQYRRDGTGTRES
jgi:hypothetical protein